MAVFAEANRRLYQNVFVCKDCKSKIKAPNLKVTAGRIACRKCGSHSLRPIKKK